MKNKDLEGKLSPRILIVDDMESLRLMLKAQLNRAGYHSIVEAKNGQEAYHTLLGLKKEGDPVGLILADWNMPIMNGFELLQVVRANPDLKQTPFIMITAENEQDKVLLAIQGGIDNYLIKPINEVDLLDRVRSTFSRSKSA